MKKVLVIVHDFPPVGGGGVLRTLKFVKYLPKFGWKPIILTVNQRSTYDDPGLLKEIPKNITVIRTKSLSSATLEHRVRKNLGETREAKQRGMTIKGNIFKILERINCLLERIFFIPDKRILWNRTALKRAKEIILNEHIDLVFTTGPPHSTHLIGLSLKNKYGLPWITDFRDGWTSGPEWKPLTGFHKWIEHNLEFKVLRSCSFAIAATGPICKYLIDKYNFGTKIITITNGFDPGDFSNENQKYKKNKKFTITYAGSLKRKRTARDFYEVLSYLIKKKFIRSQELDIRFYGRVVPSELQQIYKYGLGKIIKCLGYKPHKEVCDIICKSDVLFLTTYKKERYSEAVFTGKIFDYIAAKRPILAIITDGVAKDLILQEKLGLIADPDNIEDIKDKILEFYKMWKENRLYININPDLLKRFSRIELTKQLTSIFNKALQNQNK